MKKALVLAYFTLILAACAKHPCTNTAVTAPWDALSLPTEKRAVCTSTPDKFQAHYFNNVSELGLKVADSLQAAGFNRTSQDNGEGFLNFTFTKDQKNYFIDIYEWDGGAGLIVRDKPN